MAATNRWVIQVVEMAGFVSGPEQAEDPAGKYVQAINPDAHDGGGFVQLTPNSEEARIFASTLEALEYWGRQSTVRPVRDDGRPNRPGTAFTIELVPVNR
jgi:hypothetical protein